MTIIGNLKNQLASVGPNGGVALTHEGAAE